MFKKLQKKNYWELVDGVEGYVNAVEQLGIRHDQLDDKDNKGYSNPDSIWGELANFTHIPEKETYETRKWLYTVWKEDRRGAKTLFYSNRANGCLGEGSIHSTTNSINKNINSLEKVRLYSLRFRIVLSDSFEE
jgi:hypothetical protein